jgi:prepilin-type N-terminal cleavage/methylation domain-containing protein
VTRRPGYTLLELILTVAVIAVTTSLAVPSLDGMYPAYKQNASVDAVRAAWALARAHAIEDGRPYRFAVTPGTGNYRLSPDNDDSSAGQNAGPGSFVLNDHLPEGVNFGLAQDGGASSSDGLATVAVFLPDGTAREDAEVDIQVKGARPKAVKLRALTGAVTVQRLDGGGRP